MILWDNLQKNYMGIWDISKKQLNLNFSWEAIRFKLDKKLLEVYTIYPYLIIQKQKSKDNGKEVQIKNKLKYHINDQIKLLILTIYLLQYFTHQYRCQRYLIILIQLWLGEYYFGFLNLNIFALSENQEQKIFH